MSEFSTCALCPRLCRPACPVAVGTGREAATPTAIAAVLVDWSRGRASEALAREAATLCLDCGACQEHCHLHEPLPERLRAARRALRPVRPPPALPPLPPGEGPVVVERIDAGAGALAPWVAARLGRPVRVWSAPDGLAADEAAPRDRAAHLAALAALLAGAGEVWVGHGDVAEALVAAGVAHRWVGELDPAAAAAAVASCRCGLGGAPPLACCGGAEPLASHHPADASRVGRAVGARLPGPVRVVDGRCLAHLRGAGVDVRWFTDGVGESDEPPSTE